MVHECPIDLCYGGQFLLLSLTNMTNRLEYGTGEWIAIISFYLKKGWNFLKRHQILLKITKKLNALGRELNSRPPFRQISLHCSAQ